MSLFSNIRNHVNIKAPGGKNMQRLQQRSMGLYLLAVCATALTYAILVSALFLVPALVLITIGRALLAAVMGDAMAVGQWYALTISGGVGFGGVVIVTLRWLQQSSQPNGGGN